MAKIKKYLFDIDYSLDIIFNSHLAGIEDVDAFIANITVINAVERQITIIGEAISRLRQMGEIIEGADRIINFRNTLVHQYNEIKLDTIWYFVNNDLVDLRLVIKTLLKEN